MVARISKFTRYVSNQREMAPPARKQFTAVLPDRIGLPNGATISRTALVLPSDFSIEEWQALGAKLGVFEESIQWWLGDWWHYGAHAYGERKAKVKAKGAFPYAFGTLMNWGWVAGKVATSLRREALSWSHHELIASYPPDEQKKWLDKAEKCEWSVEQLGQEFTKLRTDARRRSASTIKYGATLGNWRGQAGPGIGSAARMSRYRDPLALSSSRLRSLAEKCDEAATWWANTRDKLRDLSAKNAQMESETLDEQEEADALHGASRTAAAASTRAGAQQQIPSRRSHSSRRSSDSSPPRSKRAVIARPR